MEYKLFKKLLDDELIDFNAVLIKNYKKLNINEKDIIVLSMLNRQECKGQHTFAPKRLSQKTGLSADDFYKSLEYLTEKKYITITVEKNEKTQKEVELFYLDPLYKEIVKLYVDEIRIDEHKKISTMEEKIANLAETVFHKQLTSLDIETVQRWMQEGFFTYAQIEKEILDAAKVGKASLKYVDSKLIRAKMLEEQNPTAKQAKEVIDSLKEKWKK